MVNFNKDAGFVAERIMLHVDRLDLQLDLVLVDGACLVNYGYGWDDLVLPNLCYIVIN